MTNTFNQVHIDALVTMVPSGTMVKRSYHYRNAVVIGRPGLPGALLLSQVRTPDAHGMFPWVMNVFFGHHPKEVADGRVDLFRSYDERFYCWEDLATFVARVTNSNFDEADYWKL